MMDEAEVALAPGRAFGENGEGYVRIALVENEQRLRQAMRNLERALNPRQPQAQAARRRRREEVTGHLLLVTRGAFSFESRRQVTGLSAKTSSSTALPR